MTKPLFLLVSLPLVVLASACGKSDDQPVATTNAVVNPVGVTCQAGTVNYNNTCVPTQQGVPPGYNGPGFPSPPPGGYCGGTYWANGYSYQNSCWGQNYGYGYRWYYRAGVIWYW